MPLVKPLVFAMHLVWTLLRSSSLISEEQGFLQRDASMRKIQRIKRVSEEGRFPKGWFWRMTSNVPWTPKTGTMVRKKERRHKKNRNEGTVAKTALSQNRPFVSSQIGSEKKKKNISVFFSIYFLKSESGCSHKFMLREVYARNSLCLK